MHVAKFNEVHQQSSMYLHCRLEGDVPTLEKTETQMLGGAPGFATPQLPRPGQRVTRKNALRIEKWVACRLRYLWYGCFVNYSSRLPRFLKASPLSMGDEILEINGVPIVDQDQKEVASNNIILCLYTYICYHTQSLHNESLINIHK